MAKLLISAINRGAWFYSKPSLGKPLLSHLPPIHHHSTTIIYLPLFRVCVVVSGSKIDRKSLYQTKAMLG
ncbi:hypothetical protein HanIR_Chr16g0826631 [Helianthus annuus]|nr:hypothetical protein HanIR_Chr16g0826631 [Helianthus annuus]